MTGRMGGIYRRRGTSPRPAPALEPAGQDDAPADDPAESANTDTGRAKLSTLPRAPRLRPAEPDDSQHGGTDPHQEA